MTEAVANVNRVMEERRVAEVVDTHRKAPAEAPAIN